MELSVGRKIKFSENCDILSSVGLCPKDYIKREINGSLSGGELIRIEIATVVARGTNLSIFDEPEAGIDLWSFNNLIKVFEELRKKIENSTILIISHQEKILNIADKVILMNEGKVEKYGEKEEVLTNVLKRENKKCCKLS